MSVERISWERVPVETVYPGITRQVVQGERQTLVRYVYQPGAVFPAQRGGGEPPSAIPYRSAS